MPSQSNTVTVILKTYTDPFNLTLIQAYMYTHLGTSYSTLAFRSAHRISSVMSRVGTASPLSSPTIKPINTYSIDRNNISVSAAAVGEDPRHHFVFFFFARGTEKGADALLGEGKLNRSSA